MSNNDMDEKLKKDSERLEKLHIILVNYKKKLFKSLDNYSDENEHNTCLGMLRLINNLLKVFEEK